MPQQNIDHLSKHLCLTPAHRALVRALEARFYEGLSFEHPILDIGCGDGYFAFATLPRPIDVGIDPSLTTLRECARLGIYRHLQQAGGAELPFSSAAFSTVISNCVLEHIPPIDQTIGEIGRVLKPGGIFIGTMVTDQLANLLGLPRLLRAIGLPKPAKRYADWFNRKALHYNMLSLDEWSAKFARSGLRINRSEYYLGPSATRVFDFLHYYALPSLFIHSLFHRWLLWPNPKNVALVAKSLRGVYDDDHPKVGSCVFVIAQKQ